MQEEESKKILEALESTKLELKTDLTISTQQILSNLNSDKQLTQQTLIMLSNEIYYLKNKFQEYSLEEKALLREILDRLKAKD